jgi:hypothetical protein
MTKVTVRRPTLSACRSPGRFQQCEALPRGHPLPTLIWQESALNCRNRCVPHFEDEGGQRGIGKSVVVVNRELAEIFVAGDKFPTVVNEFGEFCNSKQMGELSKPWSSDQIAACKDTERCTHVTHRQLNLPRCRVQPRPYQICHFLERFRLHVSPDGTTLNTGSISKNISSKKGDGVRYTHKSKRTRRSLISMVRLASVFISPIC